jgi:hypothetical protein
VDEIELSLVYGYHVKRQRVSEALNPVGLRISVNILATIAVVVAYKIRSSRLLCCSF